MAHPIALSRWKRSLLAAKARSFAQTAFLLFKEIVELVVLDRQALGIAFFVSGA